ncbi:peptidoglycan-binding domain-containing protein [Anianabacter salinae]|uniref:peptidoglycan-binding domain-containing protein n=1 Tax=Anianabacter salinae TaxID=2851023 RepID=UPI00225E0372|nr:peptidoglycan-binding domain-containing protein [Anianabacter salinae]MBV0913999.1 peptidoglycan-binding protein [Anianabacter salinae]
MFARKYLLSASFAAALSAAPAAPVFAQGEIVGGIIGGIIGGAMMNANNPRTRTVYRSTGVASATREQNRQVQTSLNYFGFPAGTPDGALGPTSRAAISQYQAFMELPATGQLTEFERNVLVTAYTRGQSGAPDAMRLISRDPQGAKALLKDQYKVMAGGGSSRGGVGYAGLPIEVSDAIDEIADSSDPSAEQLLQRAGFIQLADLNGDGNNDYILDTSFAGSSFWCSAVQCKSLVFASTPDGYRRNDLLMADPGPDDFDCMGGSCTVMVAAPAPAPEQDSGDTTLSVAGGLPSLPGAGGLPTFGAAAAQTALSSHCGRVSLVTNANGGFTTIDRINDTNLVLNEQFCLARTYSIEEGNQTAAGLQVTRDQVAQLCSAYGAAMKDSVAATSLKPRPEVIQQVGSFILSSGKDPSELTLTSRICLGYGYQSDDTGIALGSALLLVVLGEGAYGELVGHHLHQGIGLAKRQDLAQDWYFASLDAVENGATRVFAPTVTERPDLIRAALTGGSGTIVQAPAESKAPVAALPTFKVSQ